MKLMPARGPLKCTLPERRVCAVTAWLGLGLGLGLGLRLGLGLGLGLWFGLRGDGLEPEGRLLLVDT